jgi:hypothetical protein
MARNDLLFFLQDLFDKLFMLRAKFVRVILILLLKFFHGRDSIIEIHLLIVVLLLRFGEGLLLLRDGSLWPLQRLRVDEGLA